MPGKIHLQVMMPNKCEMFSMKGYKNINCSHVETELIELCKAYLNEQFDKAIFHERIAALVNAKYDASE